MHGFKKEVNAKSECGIGSGSSWQGGGPGRKRAQSRVTAGVARAGAPDHLH
jgi:hypothetical protein